jgi:hypothetical protein
MAKKARLLKNFLILSGVWGIAVFYFLTNTYFSSRSKVDEELEAAESQLNDTLLYLDVSRNLNKELEEMIKDYIR